MSEQNIEQKDGFIWLDGNIVPWKDAKIHIVTHGLHYGSSVFEGIRVYNGKPFKLEEHMVRFQHSANMIGLEVPHTIKDLMAHSLEQIKLNAISNGYIRPLAWRGTETLLIAGGNPIAHIAIIVWELSDESRKAVQARGAKLTISDWKKPPANSSPYTSKAACIYTMATIVKNQSMKDNFDDAIMLDQDDNIAEASTSNVFFIINNELHTPVPDCFLNGITRQTVIELAKLKGIKVHERKIKLEELRNAQAAFLTGTAAELVPIKSIDEHIFTVDHPLTQLLITDYRTLVNK